MNAPSPVELTGSTPSLPDCVELGVWTAIPISPPASLQLSLKEVDEKESRAVKKRGVMTFHTVGCTGCHADQQATTRVAEVMAGQVDHPHRLGGTATAAPASFLYHLGDVVYKKDKDTAGEQSPPPEKHHDFGQLYDTQFYRCYAAYTPPIFAIAGNHDGKDKDPEGPERKSAIQHFLKNFCGLDDGDPADNHSTDRRPGKQPYPYWLLRTPLAYFIGLYTNVNNAGQLDDPQGDQRPQYDWLVQTLKDIREAADGRALFLTVHYPPCSAAVNFPERGNPNLGPTPRPPGKTLEPISMALQRAFQESQLYPDVVLSAHAHLYERLTWTHADGSQIPYLIVGAGGHAPVEKLSKPCARTDPETAPPALGPVSLPDWLSLPAGDRVELAAFNDEEFGFLRLTLDSNHKKLTGEYFAAFAPSPGRPLPTLADSFQLDLLAHKLE
jgi:hypothetical protein